METDEHPFIIDYLSSGAEFVKGFWSRSINAGERGFNAREIEPSRDAVLAMVISMIWYFIYPHYKDENSTRLNVNVPSNYKSTYVLRHKINK